MTPATESPAPATIAVSTCGRRIFHTMLSHRSETLCPVSVFTTSSGGMLAAPIEMDITSIMHKRTTPEKMYVFFLPVCSL
ncbi:hypothetical protein MSSIH_2801 [Methanosarcina siciliae HI350]|uniref:Uncharacterized protein n=1 Tax=Methanosarcina siciliae HI350 TaxID=1434119 RepID=A0A0E3LBB7_9EURY|nr:hypothetical protein MSSIH_2801 [Methanosarcina siciliae HI350]